MDVTLTSHGEELLRNALARYPDQSPAQIVEEALAERLEREPPVSVTLSPAKRLSLDQWEAAFDRMAAQSDKIPLLPDGAFSRESQDINGPTQRA
jgi:hypothetical protein